MELPDGSRKRVLAALDTQSNATFISEHIGQPRGWERGETNAVSGLGNVTARTRAAKTILITPKGKVELRGRFEPGGSFDDNDTHLLLSCHVCKELGIDVNFAVQHLTHRPVQFIQKRKRKREESSAAASAAAAPPHSPSSSSEHTKTCNHRNKKYMQHTCKLTCRLSEKMMAEYIAKTGGTSRQPKQVSPEDVIIGDRLTQKQKQRVQKLVQKDYVNVFMKSPDDIPPALPNVPPIQWKLKEGVSPVSCRKPNWGPAQRQWLTDWTRRALKAGLITRADDSRWASRPVLAPKYRGDTPKGAIPDDIRM